MIFLKLRGQNYLKYTPKTMRVEPQKLFLKSDIRTYLIHKVYFCPIFRYFFKKGVCCSNLFLSIRDIEITTENEIAAVVLQF